MGGLVCGEPGPGRVPVVHRAVGGCVEVESVCVPLILFLVVMLLDRVGVTCRVLFFWYVSRVCCVGFDVASIADG